MAVGLPNSINSATDLLRFIEKGTGIFQSSVEADFRFLKQEYWKFSDRGELTNSWCSLYLGEEADFATITKGSLQSTTDVDTANGFVTVTGVSISLSKSPKVIETQIKGTEPVFQQFSNNSYDISITFNKSGPHFWQQASRTLIKLTDVLDSGETINIANPQLNLIYGINKVIVKGYSIGQNDRFYSQTPITIQLKSVKDVDIFKLI